MEIKLNKGSVTHGENGFILNNSDGTKTLVPYGHILLMNYSEKSALSSRPAEVMILMTNGLQLSPLDEYAETVMLGYREYLKGRI